MKIDGNSPNPALNPTGVTKADAVRKYTGASAPSTGGASQSDTVQLSPEAQLAASIRRVATEGLAMRQDRIDQARQKLNDGQIGADPMALAGRLIDHMLDE